MKRVLLSTISAMAILAMTAAHDGGKIAGPRTQYSLTDGLTLTEMMMLDSYSDGFGLDAEEYEFLMSQDFDSFDDLTVTFTVPTCASDGTSLNGGRPGGLVDPPIGGEIQGGSTFDDMIMGITRPGNGTTVQGVRPGGLVDPPIGGEIQGGSTLDDLMKGTRPGTGTTVQGVRPGGYGDPPIGGDLR